MALMALILHGCDVFVNLISKVIPRCITVNVYFLFS